MTIPTYSNAQRIRKLYKTILKLHRGLPKELNVLGTSYAQEEFKRHKKCNPKEAEIFMNEWSNYAITLAKQLGLKSIKSGNRDYGSCLSPDDIDKMRDEQICQLYELMVAAKAAEKTEKTQSS